MPLMSLLLNVLWLVFGGVWMAAAWLLAAVIMALTIIGLPWARSAMTIAVYTLLPFGHSVVDRDPRGVGPLGLVGNLVWLLSPDGGWRSATWSRRLGWQSPSSACHSPGHT
jgi:uncharacterized membrane protein YccF (DUF307 family)